MATIAHRDNRYKNPYTTYTATELEEAVLVSKSVGDELFITPSLAKFFPVTHCISVARDAFSVCEGWNRRGVPVERAARAYRREIDEILRQNESLERHLLVKFEDCLADPLGQLDNMCRFVGVDADEIEQIRIKAKKLVDQSGAHAVVFGNEGEKSWVAKKDMETYLDTSVIDRQRQRLSDDQREIIVEIAGDAMAALGYEIADQRHTA